MAFQSCREIDRRTLLVALNVVLRQTHVAFLVYRVVQALVRHRRHSHGYLVEIGRAKDQVESVGATAAPAPHGDAIQINKGIHFAERTKRLRLLFGRENADLAIDGLAPCSAAWRRSAGIIEAYHQVSERRDVAVEERAAAAPAVKHRLRGWF